MRTLKIGLALVLGLILSCILFGISVAQQEPPQPPPPDSHEGQPSHCSNAKTAPKPHKCDCKKTPGMGCDVEDQKCRVYCRPHKCYCFHMGCDS